MTDELHPFTPDWTIRPGVFLRRILEQQRVAPGELAILAGMQLPAVEGIMAGTVRIDNTIAERLHAVFPGTSVSFWVNAQAKYDADIARGATDTSEEHAYDRARLSSLFPLGETPRPMAGKGTGVAGSCECGRAGERQRLGRLVHVSPTSSRVTPGETAGPAPHAGAGPASRFRGTASPWSSRPASRGSAPRTLVHLR